MDLMSYIIDQALILIPVLYILGMFLKSSQLDDKYIPLCLLAISIALSFLLIGFNVQGFLQGVLVAGAAVFANQITKQLKQD